LKWYFSGRSLYADDNHGKRVFEWTPDTNFSAYFLPIENVLWSSSIFELEPLEALSDAEKDGSNGERTRERSRVG
jgi:hypothetical protein